jgi:hypothetical protein
VVDVRVRHKHGVYRFRVEWKPVLAVFALPVRTLAHTAVNKKVPAFMFKKETRARYRTNRAAELQFHYLPPAEIFHHYILFLPYPQ